MDYTRIQRIVDRQIKNFGGGGNNAALRRNGADRPVSVVRVNFKNAERIGSLTQHGDETIIISAVGLDTPPDNELDTFIQNGVEYKITQPPTPLKPDDTTVLYWELMIRH